MEEKVLAICGAILCVICTVMFFVKLFGDYPASYINYVWFFGMFIGAMLAAPLFGKGDGK